MFGFILRRILSSIPVVVVVALSIFLLVRLTPGDPAVILAGEGASAAQIDAIRQSMGLNAPLWQQFLIWAQQILSGDFGRSVISGTPVTDLILDRLEPTLSLAIVTIILSTLIAVPLGVIAAARHGSLIDRAVMAFSVLGFSIPVFVVGYGLILIFAIELRWLPVQGFRSITAGFGDFAARIIMPATALTSLYVALIARITRTSVLEVLGEDFIRTARAKGAPEARVLMKHALRNAAVPIVTIVGIGFALLVSGVVVTESVFNIPGVGRLTIDAVLSRDYPVIQAITILTSLLYVVINLLIDTAYAILNPRIRY